MKIRAVTASTLQGTPAESMLSKCELLSIFQLQIQYQTKSGISENAQ